MLRTVVPVVLAAFLIMTRAVSAATEVGGAIDVDTTWSDPVYHVTDSLLVLAGATLTISPGTVIKFDDRKGLSVNGTLVAEAAPGNPIVFTDIRDDSAGGDSNGDGDATLPEPGWWTGIYVRNGGNATLEHIDVRYGGRYVQYIDEAAIHKTGAGTLSLRHSLIRNTSRRALAIRDSTGDLIIEGNTIDRTLSYEGVFLRDNAGTISLVDNRITDAHSYGILARGSNQLLVIDNLIRNSGHSGLLLNGALISGIVNANAIEGSGTHGILMQDTTGSIELSSNSILGNGQNGLYMARSVTPVTDNTIRNNGGRGIYVAGTESTPLIAGNQIHGNDIGILSAGSANPVIGGAPEQANDIHDNFTAAVQNETAEIMINARHNWWGHATGPYHDSTNPDGLGNAVSDGVDYGDFLSAPALDRIFEDRWQTVAAPARHRS